MEMTIHDKSYKVKVGDVLKGKRTGHLYDVVEYATSNWAGHGIYSLVSRDTQETRNVADFALYQRFEVQEIS